MRIKFFTLEVCSCLSLLTATNMYGQSGDKTNLGPSRLVTNSEPSHPIRVGAKLGLVEVDRIGDPVMTVGAYSDLALNQNLVVGIGVDFWDKSSDVVNNKSTSISDLSLGAHGKYVFTANRRLLSIRPFVGAGLTGHRFALKNKGQGGSSVETNDDRGINIEPKLGADFLGGVMYEVQRQLDVLAELRYRNIFDNSTEYNQLALAGGVAYKM